MENVFSNMATGLLSRARCRAGISAVLVAAATCAAAPSARAQEQILFPAVQNAQAALVQRIRAETVRIDVAIWLLGEREITQALIDRHRAGVRVRVLGDRASIFESDIHTRVEFEHLAASGVPVRLRYHPTWFPEILHWKAAIFVGQNVVEFGSANYTTFELAPWSAVNFKDETVMFSDDPAIVRAFLTRFDRMWADTTTFLDWPQAYGRETSTAWPSPMAINHARLEPDYPVDVPGMIWSQGDELLNAMMGEINRETQRIDLVSYRLTVPSLTDTLIRRHQAGVPVRVFIEPSQYRNRGFPEYWLVGATADRLWAAGVPIKERVHEGLTHMKALVTSSIAMNGSANFTRFWQRDHNYFISAATKPALYFAFRDRIDAMWADTVNYRPFTPQPPDGPVLTSPGNRASGVATLARLEWRRAPWAVAFDVYLGTNPASLPFVGRVNAVVTEDPPQTYAITQALQPNTRYYWQIVSRTYATDLNPSLVARSDMFEFVTGTGGGTSAPPPSCPPPSPGPGWTCVNGGWIPPTEPPPAPAPAPAPSPSPSPAPSSCTTIQPAPNWVCVNGGWVPPDSPLAAGAPAPSPSPSPAPSPPPPATTTCTTIRPAANWVCVNGGWVPPDSPLAAGAPSAPAPAPPSPAPSPAPSGSCVGPDPFLAMGGGVCVNGGWVPRSHPLAGGG